MPTPPETGLRDRSSKIADRVQSSIALFGLLLMLVGLVLLFATDSRLSRLLMLGASFLVLVSQGIGFLWRRKTTKKDAPTSSR